MRAFLSAVLVLGLWSGVEAHPPGSATCEPDLVIVPGECGDCAPCQVDCGDDSPTVVDCDCEGACPDVTVPPCGECVCEVPAFDARPRLVKGKCKTTKRNPRQLKCRRVILELP